MKQVINRRFYPVYHGVKNHTYSWRSAYVADADTKRMPSDVVIGTCDDSVDSGWIKGCRGNPIRLHSFDGRKLAGYTPAAKS